MTITNDHTPAPPIERTPPQDTEAERAVLGGMLLSRDAISHAVDVLGPTGQAFYRPAHETIYQAIHDLWQDGHPADPLTVADALTLSGNLARVGGQGYVMSLTAAVPTSAHTEHYALIVQDRAKRRRLAEVATRAIAAAYSGEGNTDALLDFHLGEVQQLASGTTAAPQLSFAERWPGFIDQLERGEDPKVITSPWPDLNDVVKVRPGQLITIGAATSGGKSLMAFNWAGHAAFQLDLPVLAFSMEMSGDEIMERMTAAEAQVPLDRITSRQLTEDDWEKIARISDRATRATNLVLDDSGTCTLSSIRARARWMTSAGRPPGLIVVDYLQLMEAEAGAGAANRAVEVAGFSRGLKRLAMDFQCPVISLAQFNREARDRKPAVTDFKDSSSIEQDSNIILLLHVETDEEGNEVRPGEVDVHVAKNRNGPRGRSFPLVRRGHYGQLGNLARL